LLYEKAKNRRELHHLKFVWIERDPVLMQESAFVKRSSSLGSIGSLDVDDYLSSHASKSFDLDDFLNEEEQSSGPIDFDTSLELFDSGLDHETKMKRILEGDYCLDFIEQLLSVLPPSSTSDQELDVMYRSGELVADDIDLRTFKADEGPSCKSRRPSFVLEDETSFAENEKCWLTEAATVHKNLFQVLDMQVYLTGKSPGASQIPYARYGRPDIKKIFLEMKNEAKNEGDRHVAVCVSAPKSLTDLCRKACTLYSDDAVQFDFHSEVMSF
jgi:hypothetical protein